MNNNVIVEVSGIRLEEDSETPIMLLHEPNTSKFLPIWIGTIEAVSIAYAQEGFVHPRPQTHDLLIDIVESLNATISEVCITEIKDTKGNMLESDGFKKPLRCSFNSSKVGSLYNSLMSGCSSSNF